jgi:hypothetical protein
MAHKMSLMGWRSRFAFTMSPDSKDHGLQCLKVLFLPCMHGAPSGPASATEGQAAMYHIAKTKTKKRAAQQSSSTEQNSSRRIRWYMNRETQCDTVARRRPQTHEHTDTQTPRQTQTQSSIHTQSDIVARQRPHTHNHTDTQRQCHSRYTKRHRR